jgi:prephenate dehydratase
MSLSSLIVTASAEPASVDDWSNRTIAFLGPVGTFSEAALLGQADLARARCIPMATFADVLDAAENREVDFAFVAIENAIEGTVNVTQDTLAFDSTLLIQREVVLPIHLALMARPGVKLEDITHVWSYPHALAQSRKFVARELPGVASEPSNSTADAARMLAEADADLAATGAAIAPERAAEVYGLDVLAHEIEDHDGNATRFVLVAPEVVPAPTGRDKTTIVVFQHVDAPGSLLSILQEFDARGINLTKLESRPTRHGLGHYCFLIDFEGHRDSGPVAEAIAALEAKHLEVRFLGSYPVAHS